MRVPNYLVKGSNFRYYFRIVVPRSLRHVIGQREFRRSLKTMDHREALYKSLALANKFLRYFEAEKMKIDPFLKQLKIYETRNADGSLSVAYEMDDSDIDKDIERIKKYKEVASTDSVTTQSETMMLTTAIDNYVEEKETKKSWSKGTAAENLSAYKKLVALLGDRPIKSISRQDAIKLLRTIQGLPSSYGKSLSISVVNKRIGMLSSLYRWCIQNRHAEYNPFEGLQQKEKKRADQERDAYNKDELKALFSNFLPDKEKPSRFWIPLLMLWTGARPGELAQLTVDNVIKVNDIECIAITDAHKTKTVNAIRTIPISNQLITRGFLRFVEQRRASKSKDRRLFSELNLDRAKPAGAVSSWWNETHHKKCGIKNIQMVDDGTGKRSRRVSLYSLRHLVQTVFRNTGVPETIAAEIVGHEKGKGLTYSRYASAGQLEPLVHAINELKYFEATDMVIAWK